MNDSRNRAHFRFLNLAAFEDSIAQCNSHSAQLAVIAGHYATNGRLFIFRKDMDVEFNKIAGRKDFVPANLTPEQNQR